MAEDCTLARWVSAADCDDIACHDNHPHLMADGDLVEHDRQVAERAAAQALRDAADALDAKSEVEGGLYAGDCTEWLRARADSLAARPAPALADPRVAELEAENGRLRRNAESRAVAFLARENELTAAADAVLAAVADDPGLVDVLRGHPPVLSTYPTTHIVCCDDCEWVAPDTNALWPEFAAHLADAVRAWLRGES